MQTSTAIDLGEFMRQKKADSRLQQQIAKDLEYITAEEYAAKMCMSADTVRRRCRDGQMPNAIKDGKKWLIGIEPTFSREEYDKVKLENAELRNTLKIILTILNERVI